LRLTRRWLEGSQSPVLLHRFNAQDNTVGQGVSEHILLILGLYIVPKDIYISNRVAYMPVFAITEVHPAKDGNKKTSISFDFFSGQALNLLFLLSHLFAALLPSPVKKALIE
jgi:hypothetical protein